MVSTFVNELSTNFGDEKNIERFEKALSKFRDKYNSEIPLIIGSEEIYTDKRMNSYNPSDHKKLICKSSSATKEHVDKAMEQAEKAFRDWSDWSAKARTSVIFRAAAITRKRRYEISAAIVSELGKSWQEADGEVSEAVDFMEYYARQALDIEKGVEIRSRPGEDNQFIHIPLGVGVTISPWNFPYSILAGTTIGPVAAGNTVLLKPASLTPLTGYLFMKILKEAGMPDGVVNYVPGRGSEIGDYLVEHHRTRFINFTGSKEVGLGIYEKAAKLSPGQNFLKKTSIEMGGKDTIIVDEDADLDLAADAIIQSSFAFSGQKCASCSRVVAHENIHDQLLNKVTVLAEKLRTGKPDNPSVFMGPVCDENAFDKIAEYIEIGKKEAVLKFGGTCNKDVGYFIEPTIFTDASPNSKIMQEEIFGPVIGFTKASSIEEMFDIANDTDYGLTGSIISNNRKHLERARKEFHVGNLYFNRGCTSALVGHHPFGGFKLSGTDSKVGGPGYILHFMEPKTISEIF